MKLAHRLLLGSLLVVSVLVLVVVAVIDRRLHVRLGEESRLELAREARLVGTQWTPASDVDVLADAAGDALGRRVTLIDSGGRVLGDSKFDGPALAALENHRSRPEVMEATVDGVGAATRISPSAGDEESYVAVRTTLGVARVSVTTGAMNDIFARARRDVLFAGMLALLVAIALSYLFSQSVSRPIVQLRDVARDLAAGDLRRRPTLSAPGEVGELASALHRLAEQLGSRLQALQVEESLLTELFDSLNEGAIAVDRLRRVVRINTVGRRLAGARHDAPFPVDQLGAIAALRPALDAAFIGEATGPAETELGGRIVLLTARPLADGGAVVALFDLTRLRRLEAVRRDFVANVSHELRTPLTIISGFAETLDEDPELPPDQRHHFVRTIRSNTERMQRIVDDLLDLSRIESGGWRPKPERSDVAVAAAEAISPSLASASDKGVRLDASIADDAQSAHADPTALRQILSNLVQNAVRHTAAGTVTVFAERGGDGVWVGVRDTGSGIPAEHLPRIFERFYRVDTARSREAGGTGLGLAIVKHLAEAHGGRVRVSSRLGEGTTIAAFLPDALRFDHSPGADVTVA